MHRFGPSQRRTVSLLALACLASAAATESLAGIPPAPSGNMLYGLISSDRTLTAAAPGPIYDIIGDLPDGEADREPRGACFERYLGIPVEAIPASGIVLSRVPLTARPRLMLDQFQQDPQPASLQ